MLTDKQKEQRLNTLGGSDTGALLGVNPYKSRYDLWDEKVNQVDNFIPNLNVDLGNALESMILAHYKELYSLDDASYKTNVPHLTHKKYKYMAANLDAIDLKNNVIVEAKFSKATSLWAEEREGYALASDVQPHIYAQIMHYMIVTGLREAVVIVLLDGFKLEYRSYRFKYDASYCLNLKLKELEFWGYVQRQEPPPAMTKYEVEKIYVPEEDKAITANSDQLALVDDYGNLSEELKSLQKKKKELVDKIALSLTDSTALKNESGKNIMTYRPTKSGSRQLRSCA